MVMQDVPLTGEIMVIVGGIVSTITFTWSE